jgi:hypothetical protein
MVAKHLGLPFGAVASVHHWERTGELIKAIARRLLHLPVLRYVALSSMGLLCDGVAFLRLPGSWTTSSQRTAAHARHMRSRSSRG